MAQTAQLMVAASLVTLLFVIAFLAGGFSPRDETLPLSVEQRNASIVAIAQQFDATQDREFAQVALMQLGLPDSSQAVLALAESYIAQDGDVNTTIQLIELARALGPVSRMAAEFLAREGLSPGAPAAVVIAQTATPTKTSVSRPQASTYSPINVRSGPGVDYPVVSQLQPDHPVDILGRNADRTWWQVLLDNGGEGWVAASVVDVTGPVDAVALAANIPLALVQLTSTPRPVVVAPSPSLAPMPAMPSYGYVPVSFRLRPIGVDSQRCDSGDHKIVVTVLDTGGDPINGVRVQEIYTGEIKVTGTQGKGTGRAEWDIYRGGGGVVQVVDENNNPISPQTPGMSADWPPFDLMLAAGYCNCKPHADPESCRADLESKNYLFALGHYVYEVTFQRK